MNDGRALQRHEDWDGNARRAAQVGGTMQIGCEQIVRPGRHQFAKIHDERIGNRRRVDPLTCGVAHLQTTQGILGKERDGTVIGVRGKTPLRTVDNGLVER